MDFTVAVVLGGNSAEREVSLQSGATVVAGLEALGYRVVKADPADSNWLSAVDQGDLVFNALHGPGGEDGVLQGALEILGKPYTGSGVLGSALAMDKLRTKQLWSAIGISTAEFGVLDKTSDLGKILADLGSVFVKPATEGSSIGMSVAATEKELNQAWQLAAQYDASVIYERYIKGSEYTVAILGDRALPAIRLETDNQFYDYEAKYESDDTRYFCPCGLNETEEAELADLSLRAFRALGCEVWGRVDVMRDSGGRFYVLEVNTMPGMTSHSLVPMAARAAGMEIPQLLQQVIELSRELQR